MKNFRHQSRPKKSSLIVGPQKVIEAIRAGQHLDRIYVDTRANSESLTELKQLASGAGVPINYVPAAKLNSFNVPDHHGCIALIAKVQYYDLQEVISFVVEKGESPLLLILDGITDIRNIGGIARTAYCMGVQALIIPDKGVAALNEDAILTSAGALENLAVCRVQSLVQAIDILHENGIKVFASEMTAAKDLGRCDFKDPVAIVMGSEEHGIHPTVMKICDEHLRIPMPGNFESLNVSVATGIILYEAARQRMTQ